MKLCSIDDELHYLSFYTFTKQNEPWENFGKIENSKKNMDLPLNLITSPDQIQIPSPTRNSFSQNLFSQNIFLTQLSHCHHRFCCHSNGMLCCHSSRTPRSHGNRIVYSCHSKAVTNSCIRRHQFDSVIFLIFRTFDANVVLENIHSALGFILCPFPRFQ
uniref:Uncharacterized protein n=1 Tax=Cacopsylla melanoneura TaxID=428564 RepID=A0A8D8ZSJ0_9HEMI